MCVKWWSFADIAVGSADGVAIALAFICAFHLHWKEDVESYSVAGF